MASLSAFSKTTHSCAKPLSISGAPCDRSVVPRRLDGGTVLVPFALPALALAFEFVNGFHDTANAVATVIYTKALAPRYAVTLSGICNFIGVHLGGTAVAFSIVHLLPVDLLVSIGSGAGLAMVLAVLTAAIIWNLGTWYLGLPASSSHTLIGAILGVGLTNSMLKGQPFGSGVNWEKALEVIASLLISPVIGFASAAVLYLIVMRLVSDPKLDEPPDGDELPPTWIRAILIGTCSGVSVAHGSNDGQKGVGLIMLILIGLLPTHYAINPDYGAPQVDTAIVAATRLEGLLNTSASAANDRDTRLHALLDDVRQTLTPSPRSARPTCRFAGRSVPICCGSIDRSRIWERSSSPEVSPRAMTG